MVTMTGEKTLFVSTGCSSSDILVAPLVRELLGRGIVGKLQALGGEPLRELGAELIYDTTPLSTIGTAHGLAMFVRRGFGIVNVLRKLDRQFKADPPDLVVLVDNAGINFRVLSIAHKHNVPVLYFIPPELWSVWPFELGGLKRARPRINAIFESQAKEYRDLGFDAEWIGHPILDLVDRVPRSPVEVGPAPVIGLFPGSRRQEVQQLIRPMREAATLLKTFEPQSRFILCAANPTAQRIIQADLPNWTIPVELRYRQAYDVLGQSHLALACSGTVTLEAALLGVPMIAMYRLAGVLDNLMQKLVLPVGKYHHFSLPNLLLQRKAVPELVNRDVNAERICREARALLRDALVRSAMLASLAEVRPILGPPGAVARAADVAEGMMSRSPAPARHSRSAA
jgi:lipid-A-disaccharide synthase